ncbi:MAG: site-2 protease family protein [Candidatus Micrarchaeota archaeon]
MKMKNTKPPVPKPRGKMDDRDKLFLALTIIVGAAIFWYGASSTLTNWLKAPLLLAILFGSGKLMAHFGKLENYHGIIILRGEKGFGIMHYFAKYPKLMRALADFGLSMGFGMIYSFLIFRNRPKKFIAHFVLVAFFFAALFLANATEQTGYWITAIGILGGLLFFGIASLVIQALNILTVPGTTAGAALVVPGVTIPFWEGLIAIVVAASVHEIAHGVLAMVEKLEVKNSGAILFGVLPIGAFVEPNEQKLSALAIHKKRRILIAGTTSNFLVFLLFALLLVPMGSAVMGYSNGVKVETVVKDSVSNGVLAENEVISAVDGKAMSNVPAFQNYMKGKKEGDKLALTTNLGDKTLIVGKNGKIGIYPENNFPTENLLVSALLFIYATFSWIFVINLALAIINLVPIFLTDGYRLVFEEAKGAFPSKNDSYAKKIAIAAGALSVILLLINFLPNFR